MAIIRASLLYYFQMLTLLHPSILSAVLDFPAGLLPARNKETGKLLLIMKIHKEYILAARLQAGFSFYLVPLQSSSGPTVALITAFFDDVDEPLVVKTPLFDEPLGHGILELLAQDEFEVYFFDEHGRELMGYRVTKHDKGSLIAKGEKYGLLNNHPKTWNSICNNLETWFGMRSAQDDADSIKVVLVEELFPSDLFILDTRREEHDYFGSNGFSHSALERENPGYYQEHDIVACLKRAYPGGSIAINPIRRDNGKEFVDVLAVSNTHLLLIQAKDSPNTKASLARSIDRKRRASHSQIEKAMKQAKGAAAHARERNQLELIIDKVDLDVQLDSKKIVNLVVVQEMFVDEGDAFVARYRDIEKAGEVFVLLDYSAFNSFCYEFQNEELLLGAFADYSEKILAGGKWLDPQAYVLNLKQKRLNLL